VCTGRQLCLADLPDETAETISLLFEIMGWQVLTAPPSGHRGAPPRLFMHGDCITQDETIVAVTVDDPEIAAVLAANGLDRLTLPVSLPALEQLMVFAG